MSDNDTRPNIRHEHVFGGFLILLDRINSAPSLPATAAAIDSNADEHLAYWEALSLDLGWPSSEQPELREAGVRGGIWPGLVESYDELTRASAYLRSEVEEFLGLESGKRTYPLYLGMHYLLANLAEVLSEAEHPIARLSAIDHEALERIKPGLWRNALRAAAAEDATAQASGLADEIEVAILVFAGDLEASGADVEQDDLELPDDAEGAGSWLERIEKTGEKAKRLDVALKNLGKPVV